MPDDPILQDHHCISPSSGALFLRNYHLGDVPYGVLGGMKHV